CGGRGRRLVKRAIRDLSPAYFAMVMATGIVSIAVHLYDMPVVADVLFGGNILAYLVLLVLTGLRLLWFPRAFFADIADHQRGPGNLTLVAGSCVLGSQFVLITHPRPGDCRRAVGRLGRAVDRADLR